MEDFEWLQKVGQISLSGLFGIAIGYTMKMMFKISLVLIATFLVFMIVMSNQGFLTIHWEKIQAMYDTTMSDVGGVQGLLETTKNWFVASIPIAGGFAGGFLIGLRIR